MFKLGEYSPNVLVMLPGPEAAQAISILVSPVPARLCTPADFGVYALFDSITPLLGAVVCRRYKFSITLPSEHRQGLALFTLCCLISRALSALLLPVIFFTGRGLDAEVRRRRTSLNEAISAGAIAAYGLAAVWPDCGGVPPTPCTAFPHPTLLSGRRRRFLSLLPSQGFL